MLGFVGNDWVWKWWRLGWITKRDHCPGTTLCEPGENWRCLIWRLYWREWKSHG